MPRIAAIRHLLVTISLFTAGAVTLWAAYTPVSLIIGFDDLAISVGVKRDNVGPYTHKEEGKVPLAMIDRDGVIVLDTRGSTRTLCIYPSPVPSSPGPSLDLAPMPGCYAVLLRTLITPDNERVADVPLGHSLDFGMDVYWNAPTSPGGPTFDYVLEYKRVAGNGVTVRHPFLDTWTVENMVDIDDVNGISDNLGQISVYRKGRNGGWSVVGIYEMPVRFTAVRH